MFSRKRALVPAVLMLLLAGFIALILHVGSQDSTVYSFPSTGKDLSHPIIGLVYGRDGFFYGAAGRGGPADRGGLFRVRPNGSDFQVLHYFTAQEGVHCRGRLLYAGDGNVYGTTEYGGANNDGTLFSYSPGSRHFTLLRSFTGLDGINPYGSLLEGHDGYLYGTAEENMMPPRLICGAILVKSGTYTMPSNAAGKGKSVTYPLWKVARYGRHLQSFFGGGVLYRVHPDGSGFQIVHEFHSPEGVIPVGSPALGADGRLYGLLSRGIPQKNMPRWERGALYSMKLDGSDYRIEHIFSTMLSVSFIPSDDGMAEEGGMNTGHQPVVGSDGALYNSSSNLMANTVFRTARMPGGRLMPGNRLLTMLSAAPAYFISRFDPASHTYKKVYTMPLTPAENILYASSLAADGHGHLYGAVTVQGHTYSEDRVFRINQDGTGYTMLYSSRQQPDLLKSWLRKLFPKLFPLSYHAHMAYGNLQFGPNGSLYECTLLGGNKRSGSIYRIAP